MAEGIRAATGIEPADQILLTADGGKADAGASLLQPPSSGAGSPLVLFNRRTLGSSAVPEPCVYDLDEIVVPDSSSVTYSATAMTNPAMAVVQTFERTFCLHVDQARAYLDGCRKRHDFVLQNASCARNQVLGMQAAIANLSSHTTQIKEEMTTFLTQFEQDGSKHRLMLERVEEQLAFLDGIVLDESVRRDIEAVRRDIPEARTLMQCCEPEDQLRKHAAECGEYISSLHAKVLLVPAALETLAREVKKIIASAAVDRGESSPEQAAEKMPPNTVNTPKGSVWVLPEQFSLNGEGSLPQWMAALSACSKHSAPNLGRLQEIVSQMESHHSELERMLQQGQQAAGPGGRARDDDDSPLNGSMTDHFAALDARHKVHEQELLPELEVLAQAVGSQVTASCEARTLVAKFVASQLHRVSAMQYAIVQQVRNKLDLFQAGLAKQARAMDVFEHLSRAPPAYSAFLVEKDRRAQYSSTVAAATATFAQAMEAYREEELRLRDEFLNAHGRHLPKPIHDTPIMSMQPGRVDVQAPPALPGTLPVPSPRIGATQAASHALQGADVGTEAATPTVESLMARVTELELENGRLRSARRTGSSTMSSTNSQMTDSEAALEPPSIENLDNSVELALCRCWEASGGTAEAIETAHQTGEPGIGNERGTTQNVDLDSGKLDVELLVERIHNSREALKKAESRLAAQAGEIVSHVEAQEQLTRELCRLQEYEGKYRAFVSAVLRAEQAATRAAAVRESALQTSAKTGTADDSASLRDMAMTPPPSPNSNSQLNHCSSLELPPPPGATVAAEPTGEASAPPVVNPPESTPDASVDAAPSLHAGVLELSTTSSAAAAAAGERRGSGDWLETLAETVCSKLNAGAALGQELHDLQQQLQLQEQRLLDSQSANSAPLNTSMVGDEKSVLAFSSVDVNDLVLFYPVVSPTRCQVSQDATEDQSTTDGVDVGKSHASKATRLARICCAEPSPQELISASVCLYCFVAEEKLELAVLPQRSDVIWQALVSPECGEGLPHYLNTESLVCVCVATHFYKIGHVAARLLPSNQSLVRPENRLDFC